MRVFTTRNEITRTLSGLRSEGQSIGLVPTMGALHDGHRSLVKRCASENTICVVSIFVNPTQFNDPKDLEKYPRTPEKDLAILEGSGTDMVFMPAVEEMYPEEDQRIFDLGGLDQVMEGKQRPGHFNGVAQIVSKLFDTIPAHRAYFGQKDFQQLTIIRRLAGIMALEIEIVACPIIREEDGLAMGARNVRLSPAHRREAPFIFQVLGEARSLASTKGPAEVTTWVEDRFRSRDLFQLEYFEIVDGNTLNPLTEWTEGVNKVACIAVLLGGVRLIDNMIFD
jgi:pantoate--beta-alanine ligase